MPARMLLVAFNKTTPLNDPLCSLIIEEQFPLWTIHGRLSHIVHHLHDCGGVSPEGLSS